MRASSRNFGRRGRGKAAARSRLRAVRGLVTSCDRRASVARAAALSDTRARTAGSRGRAWSSFRQRVDQRAERARFERGADRPRGGIVEHEDVDPHVRIQHHEAPAAQGLSIRYNRAYVFVAGGVPASP